MATFGFTLGETADMTRESTARFAADRVAPLATEIDKEVTVGLSTEVIKAEPAAKELTLSEDSSFGYGKLVLAISDLSSLLPVAARNLGWRRKLTEYANVRRTSPA